jgi:hypothetical protein
MIKRSRSITLLVVLFAATLPTLSAAPIGSNPPPKRLTFVQIAETVVQVMAQFFGMH